MIASWDRSEFFRFAVGDDVGGNIGTTFVAFDHCCPIHDWFGKPMLRMTSGTISSHGSTVKRNASTLMAS